MVDLGVSPITNTIYAGKLKPSKFNPKLDIWVGKKQDVTDQAIRAVFEHMLNAAKETGYYAITFPGHGTMSFEVGTEEGSDAHTSTNQL